MSNFTHHDAESGPITWVLESGETVTVNGETVPDPETGELVPAAVLRVPLWRLAELADALTLWSVLLAVFTEAASSLPTEEVLAETLRQANHRLAVRQPATPIPDLLARIAAYLRSFPGAADRSR